jgi:hypothetical protein
MIVIGTLKYGFETFKSSINKTAPTKYAKLILGSSTSTSELFWGTIAILF